MLRALIAVLVRSNRFYGDTLRTAGLDRGIASIHDFTDHMPLTTKQQIIDDQLATPPYGTNLTFPQDRYTRLSQTSGTTGKPLRWLDTAEDWQDMLHNWTRVFEAAGAEPGDRIFFAFSFGPFIGFWTAFEAAAQRGLLCIPGGGMSSSARIAAIRDNEVTVLCCTPTYAIHLGQAASREGLGQSKLRRIIVAGEPGGSVPATRALIERLWPGTRVFDHYGMTEVGPVGFENPQRPGTLHVIESSYLAEIIDPVTESPVKPGSRGELVLTTLKRPGSPLLRYRTGDLVRQSTLNPVELGRAELALDGGILGRTDDMVLIRGVNVYPSAVDHVVRTENQVIEYRVEIHEHAGLAEMTLMIEPNPDCPDPRALCDRLCAAMRNTFQLRVSVVAVEAGRLPRFEMKAMRWARTQKATK